MRLNKYLANSGIGSRRECDSLVQDVGVEINGELVFEPGRQVNGEDVVIFRGKTVGLIDEINAIIFNKPLDCLTSLSDDRGRKTIYDFLPVKYRNYKYAGRLDYNSTGLVLLVNRSSHSEFLANPDNKIPKRYVVVCKHQISDRDVEMLENGITLDDGVKTKPAQITKVHERKVIVQISEGKKRQVRRMFRAVDNIVISLHRESMGTVSIAGVKEGSYRDLTAKEMRELFSGLDVN